MFGIFERFERGWEMATESLNVLWQDKELLVFPVISLSASVLVMGSFAWPIWSTGYGQWFTQQSDWHRDWLLWATLLGFYTIIYFITLFFNSALVACALIRLRGGDPTLADGFRAAWARLPQIASWALASATVGVILKVVEKRSDRWGEKFVASIAGFAWSLATFFVVPVLVVEKTGPLDALKRSSRIIRDTWGESFVADLGIGLIGMLASLPAYFLLILGGMSLTKDRDAQGFVLLAGGVLWLIIVAIVISVLEMIARAGLYLQAADEKQLRKFEKRVLGETLS